MINLIDMINLENLPYFGKINAISSIKKIDNGIFGKYYLVKRYDDNGKVKKEDFKVPAKFKPVKGLIEDYCNDIKDYLSKNETKYIEYRKKKKVFNINISLDKMKLFEKIAKIGILLGTILVGVTFSVVSIPLVFYIGMTFLVISGIGAVVVNDITKELKQGEFVVNYDNLCKKLNEYRSCLDNKLEHRLTEYSGLSKTKDKNKENSLKMKKVKTINKMVA